MDLEANTKPTNEIQSSDGSRHEVKLAYLISLISFFCIIFCPVMIYHDSNNHNPLFMWIPQALGLLSVWFLCQATHKGDDPTQDNLYALWFSFTFSLMITICFFYLLNKNISLSYSSIISAIPIPIPLWCFLIPVVIFVFVIAAIALCMIYFDGSRHTVVPKIKRYIFIIFFIFIFTFIFMFNQKY